MIPPLKMPRAALFAFLALAVAALGFLVLRPPEEPPLQAPPPRTVPSGLPEPGTVEAPKPDSQHHTQSRDILLSYLHPDRDRWQKPDEVLAVLDLKPGQAIADIGAGSGYFTERFSQAVGDEGRVYAVDPDPMSIQVLHERLEGKIPEDPTKGLAGRKNVTVVTSEQTDVRLPAESVDWAFLCDVHFFAERDDPNHVAIPCLKSLQRALKPGGRVAVIEGKEDPLRGTVDAARVAPVFAAAGLDLEDEHDLLERHVFLIFRKR